MSRVVGNPEIGHERASRHQLKTEHTQIKQSRSMEYPAARGSDRTYMPVGNGAMARAKPPLSRHR